ncbi:MAG: RNA ligase [Candidatus Micrarchaeota archaeon]
MEKKELDEAIKRGKIIHHKEDIEYYRFREGFREINRGRVITRERVVPGYPHIKRIFTLDKGIEKNITEKEIYIEEKIDGFNVRVAIVEGKVFAFSRGGFIDLFSTEKAREMKLEKFFKDHPKYVLCGEMVGNTPYTLPTKKFDVKFLVFDIGLENETYLPIAEKYKLLDKYDIESVPRLGKFSTKDIDKIKKIALDINNSNREGIVIKTASRKETVKYVVANSDIADVEEAVKSFFDMPPGFFMQRIFRASMFLNDFGLKRDEYEKRMGKAFFNLIDSIKQSEKEGHSHEEYEILVKDPRIYENIKKHMSKEIRVETVFEKKEGNRKRIRFRKIYRKTSEKINGALRGRGQID